MTIVATSPFQGATALGMERINGRKTQGENTARAALLENIAQCGEAVIEIAHPSTRCYELEWARTAQWRKSDSVIAWIEAVFHSALNVIVAPAIGIGLMFVAVSYFGKSSAIAAAVAPILLVAAGIGLGVSVARFMKVAKARAEGNADFFVRHYIDWRALQAVAMTAEALYFTELEKDAAAVTVHRIPYADIQTCAFSVDNGIGIFRVFGNDGSHLAVGDPRNERIRGASHLRELVVARLHA